MIIDTDDPALNHQRCAELVTHLIVLNQDLPTASKALGLKRRSIEELVASETFQRLKAGMLTRLGIVEEAWQDNALRKLRTAIPESIDKLVELRDCAEKDADKLRAVENILDRGGIERKSAAEIKHTVSLDQETVDRLSQAAAEVDAIDVTAATLSDFAYAYQRPTTAPLRDQPPTRANAGQLSPESKNLDLLHGQGRPGLRGPNPQLPRRDGELDSTPHEAQIRPRST